MHRILYISPGPPPPNKNPQKNTFQYLSRYFDGDILAPGVKNDKNRKAINDARLASGNFYYHVTFSSRFPRIIRPFWNIFFYLSKGTYLHYFKKKFDIIVTYGPFTTGLAGYLLKKITKAKLIVEIPGNPKKSFLLDSETPDTINKLKNKISDFLVQRVINGADHIRLLYPLQLDGYKKVGENRVSLFHNFVPIATIRVSEKTEKFILFLGYPWFLKGVDILIQAFKLVSHEFPEYRLKIVGFCPQRRFFEKLAEGSDKIELCNPVFHEEAMDLMSKCALFVLPSRTEAMGRVLLEAMASKKPIIASNVDGIPFYIKHGYNGLLFESENVADLADKIKTMIKDTIYAKQLAENGHTYVYKYLSEEQYVLNYTRMINKVIEQKQGRLRR